MSQTTGGDDTPAKMRYKNWKGNIKDYTIIPQDIYHGSTQYHPEPQWLLRAFLVERDEEGKRIERTFAMKDILAWW